MNLIMVYAPLVCVLVMTRISVDTQTVTFDYTTTGKWIAKSGSSGPASPSTPLVGCSVLPTSTRLSDQRFVSEQTSWTCDISTASSLMTNEQQQDRKKILFMICEPRYLCKYTFSLEPGVTNIKLIQKFIVTERVKEVHYHQVSNKIFWITRRFGFPIHWRLAEKRSQPRELRVPIQVITFAIDNDTNNIVIMAREGLRTYHIFKGVFKRVQHFTKPSIRSDRLQLDMYNRKVYYTWGSRQVINAFNYDGTTEVAFTTSLKKMQTFVVDTKGSKVYTCEGGAWSIYNMNTTKTTSLQTVKGVACDAPAIHGRELYLSGRGSLQVISMDSDESITILILLTRNRRPSVYLPEIFSSPN